MTFDMAVSGGAELPTFSGEIKSCRCASSPITPVDCALPMRVLIVVEDAVCVLTGVPILAKGKLWNCSIQVLLYKLAACKSAYGCQVVC